MIMISSLHWTIDLDTAYLLVTILLFISHLIVFAAFIKDCLIWQNIMQNNNINLKKLSIIVLREWESTYFILKVACDL